MRTPVTLRVSIAVGAALVAASLLMLARVKPEEAVFLQKSVPMAFAEDGDIWTANKMDLVNLTPNTASSDDVDPLVSPDGRKVAFASDRDGDFEIYTVDIFTGELQQITDNAVSDRRPVWSPDGRWISYESPHFSSPTHAGIFFARSEGMNSGIPVMNDVGETNLINNPNSDAYDAVGAR